MSAMERMSIAKGLPRHLKIYSVSGAFKLLFAVDAPAVPEELNKPLKPGTWLAYLVTAAKGAGHPIADTAKTPLEKEPAAWAGVLEGVHDKLVPDVDKISAETPMKDVVASVAKRLERESNEERNALRAKQPAAPAPKTTPPRPRRRSSATCRRADCGVAARCPRPRPPSPSLRCAGRFRGRPAPARRSTG